MSASAAAQQAAKDYVRSLPEDVDVGLVYFNDEVRVASSRPPTARQCSRHRRLGRASKTALYDAVLTGLDQANPDCGARLFLLSDGGDTVSAATLEDVKQAARRGVPIDVVALTPNIDALGDPARRSLARSDGQFFLATDVGGLAKAFDEATGSFGGKVAVDRDGPAGRGCQRQGRRRHGRRSTASSYRGTAQMPRAGPRS